MKITRFRDIPQFVRDGYWQCDYTLPEAVEFIDKLIREDGLDTDPDFQRGHVWTEAQQIAWLEFFHRGGKTGNVIYINNPNWNRRKSSDDAVLIDGKQRLEAARRFVNNEIAIFGSYFREFTDRPSMSGPSFKVNVNTLQSRAEVLQWYIDMNAGGTPHTSDEIDNVRTLLDAELRALAAAAGRESEVQP